MEQEVHTKRSKIVNFGNCNTISLTDIAVMSLNEVKMERSLLRKEEKYKKRIQANERKEATVLVYQDIQT